MTKGIPLLGYRMRTCFDCGELYDPRKKEITYEHLHDDDCQWVKWYDIVYCSCENTRKILGLDDEEKMDKFVDDEPDCTCKRPLRYVWVCEDCRNSGC